MNHNKNEDNNTDRNKDNDHIQLLNRYNSQIKYIEFPKINRGQTTLFQVQKFSYNNEECYNYWEKMYIDNEKNLLFKKLLQKCLMILQII